MRLQLPLGVYRLRAALADGRGWDLPLPLHAEALRPAQVDMQQPVIQARAADLDPIRQDEGALKLPRGDAAVQELPLAVGLVLAAMTLDHQLIVLGGDADVPGREPGHRQGNPQPILADPFDVIGRVTVAGGLASPL